MSSITTLKLGNKTFKNNLIQGPLAGVSCAPFRLLTHRYSQPAFCCTEMISCKTLINKPAFAQRRFIEKDPNEGIVCFQLSASDTEELAKATSMATEWGADLIDLNCGCPVKKIRKKGAGSGLLTNPEQIYKLIGAMKENTDVPVSIKIRVEGGSDYKFNQEVAAAVQSAQADFLIVHGRHWTEHYETPCDHNEVKFFVDALTIPVIGNGDIADLASLKKMLDTGCAGVMLGRSGVGQPWLIKQLITEMSGEKYNAPSLKEIADCFMEHITRLSELLNSEKVALLQARTLSRYYGRRLQNRREFCAKVNECGSLEQLKNISTDYFQST